MRDVEPIPDPEDPKKAQEQSSTLLGIVGFLNNFLSMNPNPNREDLLRLNRGLNRLARRIQKSQKPLPDIEIMPGTGIRAVQINSRDLEEQAPPTPTSSKP